MNATLVGHTCLDCAAELAPSADRCEQCGGPLEPHYDVGPDPVTTAPTRSMWEVGAPLPAGDAPVTLGEGATPLVSCPAVAADVGVGSVLVKDEGRNPTGSVHDRGMSVALSVARSRGSSEVRLPATGVEGQAAAAYAGRAGIDCRVAVPTRAPFLAKAMVNVHGADMRVVQGRYPAALETAGGWSTGWSLAPMATPYRVEGAKTLAYELLAQLPAAPDTVVVPCGAGETLLGVARGFQELVAAGSLEAVPSLVAAQAAGCAPIVDALATDEQTPAVLEHPDTICGAIEIPDPPAGTLGMAAVRESGGTGVTATDASTLEAAVTLAAHEGVALAPSAGVAVAILSTLREAGQLADDDTVVVIGTVGGRVAADVLRSHLMGQGI